MAFILASSSPRRLQLLHQIGYIPNHIVPSDIDETPYKGEKPLPYVHRLSLSKAEKVAVQFPQDVVLAADTIVYCRSKLMGKPLDSEQAELYLNILSGRRHRVYTGVCVRCGDKILSRVSCSIVSFKRLHTEEIKIFIESNDWQGKAGGYSISGPASMFITHINGVDSNVSGLPLQITYNLLQRFLGLPRLDRGQ